MAGVRLLAILVTDYRRIASVDCQTDLEFCRAADRASSVMDFDRLNKPRLHIAGQFNAAHDFRPKLKRRCFDQRCIEGHVIKIVVQVRATTAMARVTRHTFPWVALAPVADAANVIARRISQEDVSAFISALRVPLQSSACSRQRLKIGIIIHSDQQIRILWILFVCRQ